MNRGYKADKTRVLSRAEAETLLANVLDLRLKEPLHFPATMTIGQFAEAMYRVGNV